MMFDRGRGPESNFCPFRSGLLFGESYSMPRVVNSVALLALLAIVSTVPGRAADPDAGQAVFKTQCGICHSPLPGKNMVGPSLFGVVGRKSGSIEGFHYSAANKAADITWTPEVLDKYLTAPREVVPGTIMTYAGLKDDAKRADLIAWLETLH
jgi:cytochrome c